MSSQNREVNCAMINPVILIVAAALIVLCFLYCLILKPQKPVMTFLFILLLALFITCTGLLNQALTPGQEFMLSGLHMNKLVPFLVGRKKPSLEEYELAFNTFRNIDIGLFFATAASMILEIWRLILKPGKYSGTKKEPKKPE